MWTEELQPLCCGHKSQVYSAKIRLEKLPLSSGQSQFCVAAGESPHVAMKEAANEKISTELKRFRVEKQYNVHRSEEAATEAVLSHLGNISEAKENKLEVFLQFFRNYFFFKGPSTFSQINMWNKYNGSVKHLGCVSQFTNIVRLFIFFFHNSFAAPRTQSWLSLLDFILLEGKSAA